MATKNNLEKVLLERLDDLSEDEVGSILENLVKEFYKAYYVYNRN